MATERRRKQIARQIQQRLAEVFLHEMKDPRAGFLTVTGVEVNTDLSVAHVRWTVHDPQDNRSKTERMLAHARGFLRTAVAHTVEIRNAPNLVFEYDEGLDRAAHIERILHEVLPAEGGPAEAAAPDELDEPDASSGEDDGPA